MGPWAYRPTGPGLVPCAGLGRVGMSLMGSPLPRGGKGGDPHCALSSSCQNYETNRLESGGVDVPPTTPEKAADTTWGMRLLRRGIAELVSGNRSCKSGVE